MGSIPTPEERQEIVSNELEGLNYIYKHPGETVSASYFRSQMLDLTPVKTSRGAFCSALVSRVYSLHLRRLRVAPVTNEYGYQIGALALATAAVCRSMPPHKYTVQHFTPLGRARVHALEDRRRY